MLAFGLAGTPALTAFFYLATSGALSLLVVYVLVSVNVLRLQKCWTGAKPLFPRAVLPVGGAGQAAAYVLYAFDPSAGQSL